MREGLSDDFHGMPAPAAPAAIAIRTARIEDAEVLARLVTELEFPASAADIAQRLSAMLAAGETVLVALHGDQVVGMLSVHVTPVLHRPAPVGRLTALIVAAEARGLGAGRQLVAAGELALAARGCTLIEVTSNRKLTAAHAFYEHLGYDITSYRLRKQLASVTAAP